MSNLNPQLYEKLYLIRRAEESIRDHYSENEMKTPMHMSMGEEAIAVGICHALKPEDQVFGTYRSHALYLAKTMDVEDFFAELYGKDTARLKGKGGSMHLCAPDLAFMGTSAIVGSVIPAALGAAFANRRADNGKVVAVFFGDGATDEGTFWESLNVACLMNLPIILVCEDNRLAVHTPTHLRQGYDSITEIVSHFRCNVLADNTTDAETIHGLARKAMDLISSTGMPCFMHLEYYRYLEHVGVNEDFDAGYRSRDEFEKWYSRDPVALQRNKLLKGGAPEAEIVIMEKRIDERVDEAVRLAMAAPFVDDEELYRNVFAPQAEEDYPQSGSAGRPGTRPGMVLLE